MVLVPVVSSVRCLYVLCVLLCHGIQSASGEGSFQALQSAPRAAATGGLTRVLPARGRYCGPHDQQPRRATMRVARALLTRFGSLSPSSVLRLFCTKRGAMTVLLSNGWRAQ